MKKGKDTPMAPLINLISISSGARAMALSKTFIASNTRFVRKSVSI
jgi:hypothetical protein